MTRPSRTAKTNLTEMTMQIAHQAARIMLALGALLMLCGGCRTTETVRSVPVSPGLHCNVHTCFNEGFPALCIHCQLPDAKLEVAAENGVCTPTQEPLARPNRLTVRFAVNPVTSELILDTSKIFYLAENLQPLAPCIASGWIKRGWTAKDLPLGRGGPETAAITEPSYFYLDYAVDPHPEVEFTIRVLGLSKDGQAVAVPDIHFRPEFIEHTHSLIPIGFVFAPR